MGGGGLIGRGYGTQGWNVSGGAVQDEVRRTRGEQTEIGWLQKQ